MLHGYRRAKNFFKKAGKHFAERYYFNIPEEYGDNVLIYEFLRENFGLPTISNKNTGLDFKLQWFYHIKTPHGHIEIYDKERSYLVSFAYAQVEGKQIVENSDYENR